MNRNDLCACGSGKRFKHCHGALAPAARPAAPSAQAVAPPAAPSALHLEALAVHRTGALRRAEALYRRAIERDPADLDSVHMLGVVQFERMRYREALELLWDACERSEWKDEVFRHNLGLVLAKLLAPAANERQEALVRAYTALVGARRAAPVVEALVSVILTARGDARFIERAVDSVANQTYRNLELVVVDDSVTDAAFARLAPRLPQLGLPARLFRVAHRNAPRSANDAATRAQGRYLAFLDGDDAFTPRHVERMVAEIARAEPLWGFARVASPAADAAPATAGERPGEAFGAEPASFTKMTPSADSNANLFIERAFFVALGGFRNVAEHGAELRERAARDVEPVVVHDRTYVCAVADATSAEARRTLVDAQLTRALTNEVVPANVFSPLHPANRDVVWRSLLRGGHGDRVPVALLRALASTWRERATPTLRPRSGPARGSAKTAIVVLGPYRSGTSALARVLNLCGAFLPQRVVAARLGINPKGFWETEAVNDLDARLMQYLGADWNRVDFTLPRTGPLVEEFLENSRDVLASEYGDAPLVLIKDPRICVLAPLWHRALKEHGYRPAYVVCVRNPIEVARSLGSDMPASAGIALWSDYMRRVENFVAVRDVRSAHVRYVDLLDDWRSVVQRLARELDVPLRTDAHAPEADAFLDVALRNHRASDADLGAELTGADPREVRALYARVSARCAEGRGQPRLVLPIGSGRA